MNFMKGFALSSLFTLVAFSAVNSCFADESAGTESNSPVVADSAAIHWQTYTAPSSLFTLQYPDGWEVSTDPKSGKIEAKNSNSASLAILPFYTPENWIAHLDFSALSSTL